MAYDYAPIKATAATLLADFGQSVTVRVYTVTGTDPVAGTVTRTSADTTASCVKTRFNERNTPSTALIEQGDLLAILDKVVAVDDEVVIGTGAASSLTVNPTGDENALTYTAATVGVSGDDISIEYVDPSAADQALAVVVSGDAITVNLATDGGGSITSTAAQVKTAIEGSASAAALVTVAIDASDTGGADDGSGVVTAMSAANLTGGSITWQVIDVFPVEPGSTGVIWKAQIRR